MGIKHKMQMQVRVTRDNRGNLEYWPEATCLNRGETLWYGRLGPRTPIPRDWFPHITWESEPVPMVLVLMEPEEEPK